MNSAPITALEKSLGIIGAGAFGTSMAITAARAKTHVTMITTNQAQEKEINEAHTNQGYFPNLQLLSTIIATTDIHTLKEKDAVMVAVPASALAHVLVQLSEILPQKTPVILTSKGLVKNESGHAVLPYTLAKNILPNPIVVLAGPNFAIEIADNLPTATSMACEDGDVAREVCALFHHTYFRCYPSGDPIGAQIAGVVKNVLAIGCGFIAGYGWGVNTQAALMTRGLAEMTRLGTAIGAKPMTFMGLAGVGDLVLTCTSVKSRNYSLGFSLGQGIPLADLIKNDTPLAEGYYSASALCELADAHHVDMPLCRGIEGVLLGGNAESIIQSILSRPTSLSEFLDCV